MAKHCHSKTLPQWQCFACRGNVFGGFFCSIVLKKNPQNIATKTLPLGAKTLPKTLPFRNIATVAMFLPSVAMFLAMFWPSVALFSVAMFCFPPKHCQKHCHWGPKHCQKTLPKTLPRGNAFDYRNICFAVRAADDGGVVVPRGGPLMFRQSNSRTLVYPAL